MTATYGDTGVKIKATTNGNGAISYAVKSGDAVTVDAEGNLTIVQVGTAVITVTAAETDDYMSAEKDVTVTINPKTYSPDDIEVAADGDTAINTADPATAFIDAEKVIAEIIAAADESFNVSNIVNMALGISRVIATSYDANGNEVLEGIIAAVDGINTIAYEIHPVVTMSDGTNTVTYRLTADDLTGKEFDFTLELGAAFANKKVVINHYNANGELREDWTKTADENGNVELSMSSFSIITVSKAAAVNDSNLKFQSVSVTLSSDISLNFIFNNTAYSNVTVKANGNELTADGTIYKFINIGPYMLADSIEFVLTATRVSDGAAVTNSFKYSAKAYFTTALTYNGTNDLEKQTIIDLVAYGTAAQKYKNYNTDNLVVNILTSEQAAQISPAVDLASLNNVYGTYKVLDGATVSFEYTTLQLANKINIIVKVSDPDVTVRVTTNPNDETYWIYLTPDASGNVIVDTLKPGQMKSTVFFTAMKDGAEISDTITYSIESYAQSQADNTELEELLSAIINYGISARALIDSKE